MNEENELLELCGTITSIIFKNEENGYSVISVRDDSGTTAVITGCFPYAFPGESIIATGEWVNHPQHGKQFKSFYSQRQLPDTVHTIYDYLCSGAVSGIGPVLAGAIINKYGQDSLKIILNSPEKLAEIHGISSQKANKISSEFKALTEMTQLTERICALGARPFIAMNLYKIFGKEAYSLLQNNPYIIASQSVGGTFYEADQIAMDLGIEGDSTDRIKAAVIYELLYNKERGHCFIPLEKLINAVAELIEVNSEKISECIEEMISENEIHYEKIASCQACYLPQMYEAEKGISDILLEKAKQRENKSVSENQIKSFERQFNIQYSDKQKEIIKLAAAERALLLTGGPGTGKTTTIKAILALYDTLGYKTVLTAPTGRAAKRMSELSGNYEAYTVHRLLKAHFDSFLNTVSYEYNENNKLKCDAVILDEASMVDIELCYALLKALPDNARFIMVGDSDQLPSVGPGNVFSSIIRSGAVTTVKLDLIFRQKECSRIISNSHMINKGRCPDLSDNSGDFFRLKRTDQAKAVTTVCDLISTRLPSRMGFRVENIQIITPTRKGALGTVNLNRALQNSLNPSSEDKNEVIFGDDIFREGDRVMQIVNNYDILWKNATSGEEGCGVFNGDIGIIEKISRVENSVQIRFDENICLYGFEMLSQIEHAWAVTVHKSQGSEYEAVIFAVSSVPPQLAVRSILYTGITRAKKLLILVGDDDTIISMINNNKASKRYTALKTRLKSNENQ